LINAYFFRFGVSIIIIGITLQYFIWTAGSASKVEEQVEVLFRQIFERASVLSYKLFNNSITASEINRGFYDLGLLDKNNLTQSDLIYRDRYFFDLMGSFKDSSGRFSIDSVYVAFMDSGKLYGSKTSSDGKSLYAISRDLNSNYCMETFSIVTNMESSYFGSRGNHSYTDRDCLFDPRTEEWFKISEKKSNPFWMSQTKTFSGYIGFKTLTPLYSLSGAYIGVLGVDIRQEYVSTRLVECMEDISEKSLNPKVLIMSANGNFLASSLNVSILSPLLATSLTDVVLSETAELLLKEENPKIADIQGFTQIKRKRNEPNTYESLLRIKYLNDLWVIALVVDSSLLLSITGTEKTVELLLGLGTVFVSISF
jgi:hypothetical protein